MVACKAVFSHFPTAQGIIFSNDDLTLSPTPVVTSELLPTKESTVTFFLKVARFKGSRSEKCSLSLKLAA